MEIVHFVKKFIFHLRRRKKRYVFGNSVLPLIHASRHISTNCNVISSTINELFISFYFGCTRNFRMKSNIFLLMFLLLLFTTEKKKCIYSRESLWMAFCPFIWVTCKCMHAQLHKHILCSSRCKRQMFWMQYLWEKHQEYSSHCQSIVSHAPGDSDLIPSHTQHTRTRIWSVSFSVRNILISWE